MATRGKGVLSFKNPAMSAPVRSSDIRPSTPAMLSAIPSKKLVPAARRSASRIALSISAGP